MKNLLEIKVSRKLGVDHVIKAVLLEVGSPPPSEPEKQPITICLPPGDQKMGCNIIGKHLHIDPAEKGKVIWITAKKDGALYLSYFEDEKKHFLTIRDGVHFDFRDLDPKVKMHNPKDRLPYLADHYRACWEETLRAMTGAKCLNNAAIDLVPIATALWIETKAGVIVPVTPSEPKEVATPTPDKSEPAPGKPPEELPEVKEVNIQTAYAEYLKMHYSKVCEAAVGALKYKGSNGVALAKREALVKLLDEYASGSETKAWLDVYDSIWQGSDEAIKQKLDDGVAQCFEKKPAITQSAAHRAVCLSFKELTQPLEEEKI